MFGKGFVSRNEQSTWSDLTISQEKLLKNNKNLKGVRPSLSALMSAESPAAKFRHQEAKEDIFNDKDVGDSHVYLAKTEGEFYQLCQLHPESSVHWL
jgi:hypothetical protein